ncbi:hypothetical protein [Salinarimonas ramus]|uniref:Uncharacterized protein n=1 Tax=Salinarimonas ramus TaxID=690164 RepID=A0A917Q450_9HYPH|nr:hypothetical protein [Salinarimonas ramus]GGK20070.1 hypothetical protein GCM10011322_03430 [Salinarimonas ramus]
MSEDRPPNDRPPAASRAVPRAQKERTLPIDKDVFAHRLWQAIKRSGLTYRETARRAQEHLPTGLRMSDVSVWSYAKGRSLPRRMAQIEALAQVLDVAVSDLVEEIDPLRAAQKTTARIEDLGHGRARIEINQEVSWDVAMSVLKLLRGRVGDASSGDPEG